MAAEYSPVATTTLSNAISGLLKWKEAQETQKLQLLPEDEFIYLILTLKKLPPKPRTNAFKIPLPHPLHSSPQICLFLDDRADSHLIKQLIKSQNLPIAKVVRISKLKANYKPFEAKRKLCDSFDLFLADKRIVHLLPKLIGKEFFNKKKIPIPVDMGKRDWRGKVEKVSNMALLYFGRGSCSVVKVGKVGMEKGEIVENVVEGIQGVVGFVPKKWGGVRSLHLKLAGSVALPLYQVLPDLKMRIQGVEESHSDKIVEENSKIGGKKKDKGRMHEVRYMDVVDELGREVSDGDDVIVKGGKEDEESSGDEYTTKKADVNDEAEKLEGATLKQCMTVKKGSRKSGLVTKSKEESVVMQGSRKREKSK